MRISTRTSGADTARGSGSLARKWWPWSLPLVLIGCDLALIALRAATYPAFFSMPGALTYLVEPLGALILYAAVIIALPVMVRRSPGVILAMQVGIVVGLAGGVIEIVSTALESLWALPQQTVSIATLAAMLTLFLTFGVAGYAGARRTQHFWVGLGAAVWSAMVAVLLVVTFGFLLMNTALPQLAHDEVGDPDYLRSGWTDVRAFAIANTFDAGFTHLVEGPVIAALLGGAVSALARAGERGSQRRQLWP